jgi:hypothetical protein
MRSSSLTSIILSSMVYWTELCDVNILSTGLHVQLSIANCY